MCATPCGSLAVLVGVSLDQAREEASADVIRAYAAALVEAVSAVAIGIAPTARYAVDRNTDGFQEDAIGGARRHGWNERDSRKVLRDQLLGGPENRRIQRRRLCDGANRWYGRDLRLWIANGRDERRSSLLYGLTGENSAVDVCGGVLRERVVGMAAVEQRRNASGAQHAVVAAIVGNDGFG